MKKSKGLITIGLLALLALPTTAKADPCGSILCLGGLLEGGFGGPGCIPLTADFFAIQIYTPYYNPGATAAARAAFLATCPAPLDVPWQAPIIATFGTWQFPPGF